MDHNFVLNKYSFPAADKSVGFELMLDAVNGMIAVVADNDRYSLISDGFNTCKITSDYTYKDFLDELSESDPDLQIVLLECDDKSPALDILSTTQFDEVASTAYYFHDDAYSKSIDELAYAFIFDATLLSIATSDRWKKSEVLFSTYTENVTHSEPAYLRNISSKKHGTELRNCYEEATVKTLSESFSECIFSEDFVNWDSNLQADLKKKVRSKLKLANDKKFQGGEPLFKTLVDADGIREIRFNAVQGGAVRILFDTLSDRKQAVLVGFTKKSDNDGYIEAIDRAKNLLKEIKKSLTKK